MVQDWSTEESDSQSIETYKVMVQKVQPEFISTFRTIETHTDVIVASKLESSMAFRPSDVSSGSGVSSIAGIASNVRREKIEQLFNPQGWFSQREQLHQFAFESASYQAEDLTILGWISYIRNNLINLHERNKLANRLTSLIEEHDPDEIISIDQKSLTNFVMFLHHHKIEKRPLVTFDNYGCIDATWRRDNNCLTGIVFLPGREAQLVTFYPDLDDQDKINRRAATLPIGTIADVVSKRNLDSLFWNHRTLTKNHWFSHQKFHQQSWSYF